MILLGKIEVSDFKAGRKRFFEIEVNSFWVTVREEGAVIVKYTPDSHLWLNGPHRLICDGFEALEKLLKRNGK